jgi:hypothetical protein
MADMGPAGLAFLIAASIALIELITAVYPRTFFLLKKCGTFYAYFLIYGAIGCGIMLGLQSLIDAHLITLEGIGLDSPWVQAIVVGVTIKSLLHIRLFNVTAGSQSFPVGIETLMHLFEPWLLASIQLHHFNAGREFIEPRAKKHSTLGAVRNRIKRNVPQSLQNPDRAAFLDDIQKVETVIEAMELYLQHFGKRSFDRVFPP